MEAQRYLNFDVRLERSGRRYRVQVFSPAGEAFTEVTRPLVSKDRLRGFLYEIGRPRTAARRVDTPAMSEVRRFGQQLFGKVFSDEVKARFVASIQRAAQEGAGLRFRLRLDPELADLPWEYLFDGRQFFALSKSTPVVRYLELPELIEPLAVDPPLRVLVAISTPSGYPPLDVDKEKANLERALSELVQMERVLLDVVQPPTVGELQQRLRQRRYHVFHYIGHGDFDPSRQDGRLLLVNDFGEPWPITGEELGVLFQDHPSLRLAVLNSCEGARGSVEDPFAGSAQSLVSAGVPAVVAMQFEVTDSAAITISKEFYGAIADGLPVDAALAEARKAVRLSGNEIEWGTPVLYMRAPEGRVFKVAPRGEREAREAAEPEATERERVAKETKEAAERARAEQEAKELAERDQAERDATEREAAQRARAEQEAREAAERETSEREAAERARAEQEAKAAAQRAPAVDRPREPISTPTTAARGAPPGPMSIWATTGMVLAGGIVAFIGTLPFTEQVKLAQERRWLIAGRYGALVISTIGIIMVVTRLRRWGELLSAGSLIIAMALLPYFTLGWNNKFGGGFGGLTFISGDSLAIIGSAAALYVALRSRGNKTFLS